MFLNQQTKEIKFRNDGFLIPKFSKLIFPSEKLFQLQMESNLRFWNPGKWRISDLIFYSYIIKADLY